jgi:rRNA processing protein Krr1/Pno1
VHVSVAAYVESNDYKIMVENLKRRERERMMSEVSTEIEKERDALLRSEREKLKKEVEEQRSVEEIIAENQRRIDVRYLCCVIYRYYARVRLL